MSVENFPAEFESKYTDAEYIGKGGFGRVFKARNSEGKVVAVKIPLTEDEALGKSFLRELQVWQALSHRNIVGLYDANIYPVAYIEMEYCDGGTLEEVKKPLPVEEAAGIVLEIADGLEHAHTQGMIHRDLKPMNILFSGGVPKITDWGLSKVMSESKHSSKYGFSPLYAAPEQVSPKKFGTPDERTDVYQLGVIFYELVTGRLPFEGSDAVEILSAITMGTPRSVAEIDPELRDVGPIISKALEKEMAMRYQSMGEFREAISQYLKAGLKRSLKESTMQGDMRRSAYYCCELCMVHARAGDAKEALKYAVDMEKYAPEDAKKDIHAAIKHLEYCLENDVPIGDEFLANLDVIAHRVKLALQAKKERAVQKEREERERLESERADASGLKRLAQGPMKYEKLKKPMQISKKVLVGGFLLIVIIGILALNSNTSYYPSTPSYYTGTIKTTLTTHKITCLDKVSNYKSEEGKLADRITVYYSSGDSKEYDWVTSYSLTREQCP